MLRVRTVHAKPGMTLALPVLHPRRPDTVLLNAGVRLDGTHIRRLREIELQEMWIRYPRLQMLEHFVSEEVHQAWGGVTALIGETFDTVGSETSARLDYLAYKRAIQGLIEKLAARPRTQLFMQEMVDWNRPLLRHASNVAFISVLIGLRLDFYLQFERPKLHPAHARDASNLGVGAMLHDVGVLRLPRPIRSQPDGRPDETDPLWRQHARLGYQLVRGTLEASASAVVLCHHQRFDGTGFPNRIDAMGNELPVAGRNIHIFARIVAAADLFDRLRHRDACGTASVEESEPPVPTVRALRMMQEPEFSRWLDPIVLTGLIAVCPPYAPGAQVRLSDGRFGVVTNWSLADPCRPTVATIQEDLDDACDEEAAARELRDDEVIDLMQNQDLEIVECEGQDVRADNFYPTATRRYDLAPIERAIIERIRGQSLAA